MTGKKRAGAAVCACLLCLQLAACAAPAQSSEAQTASTVAMDTIITQDAYGTRAQEAMRAVNLALSKWDKQISRFEPEGDIGRINAAAGQSVAVSSETARFLQGALELAPQSQGSFALSIAPLTGAWGVTTDHPRVPSDEELAALLPLVDDSAIKVEGNYVTLEKEGMGLDLGGIAKGAACDIAQRIYEEYGLTGAYISIGGNIGAYGTKPDGTPFRIGFRDPARDSSAYIASFEMEDEVVAVSGGYERYFEEDGKRYIHIIDPATGQPVESDILSVGAFSPSGAEADFWSTTLFVWGKQRALHHMEEGSTAVLLDRDNNLYVSESLRDSFQLHAEEGEYNVVFVAGG